MIGLVKKKKKNQTRLQEKIKWAVDESGEAKRAENRAGVGRSNKRQTF